MNAKGPVSSRSLSLGFAATLLVAASLASLAPRRSDAAPARPPYYDSSQLAASNLLPGQPALLFAGESALNGGSGMAFGDGLRCAGVDVVRLGVSFPDASGDAVRGPGLGSSAGWSSGVTRRFQGWYRDPDGSPCGAGFDLTNGVTITFAP